MISRLTKNSLGFCNGIPDFFGQINIKRIYDMMNESEIRKCVEAHVNELLSPENVIAAYSKNLARPNTSNEKTKSFIEYAKLAFNEKYGCDGSIHIDGNDYKYWIVAKLKDNNIYKIEGNLRVEFYYSFPYEGRKMEKYLYSPSFGAGRGTMWSWKSFGQSYQSAKPDAIKEFVKNMPNRVLQCVERGVVGYTELNDRFIKYMEEQTDKDTTPDWMK